MPFNDEQFNQGERETFDVVVKVKSFGKGKVNVTGELFFYCVCVMCMCVT